MYRQVRQFVVIANLNLKQHQLLVLTKIRPFKRIYERWCS